MPLDTVGVKSPIAGVLSKDRLEPPPVSTRPLLGFSIVGASGRSCRRDSRASMKDNRNRGIVLRGGKGGEGSARGRTATGSSGSEGETCEGRPLSGWLGLLTKGDV